MPTMSKISRDAFQSEAAAFEYLEMTLWPDGPVCPHCGEHGGYKLTAHKEQPFMPPKMPQIAKEQIDTLAAWIQGGALENPNAKPLPVKPKAEVGLMSVRRGKPDVVPMPEKPLRKEPVLTTGKANAVIALAASPWAPLVAVGSQKQVLLYHGDTMQLVGVLPFQYGTPTVLKFSRNVNRSVLSFESESFASIAGAELDCT